jgi:hypothetical protein
MHSKLNHSPSNPIIELQDFVELKKTIVALETHFNKKFNYPYVILSETSFWLKWKWKLQSFSDSKMEFGLIPDEHWAMPTWIDKAKLHNITFDSFAKVGSVLDNHLNEKV